LRHTNKRVEKYGGTLVPVPGLDERGLLPVGVHVCTLDEVRAAFCWDDHRSGLWANLGQFLTVLAAERMVYPICVDGSFTTDKIQPSDIDLVHDLSAASEEAQIKGILWFARRREEFKKRFNVDYCPNLPHNCDFQAFFQYVGTKTGHAKNLDHKALRGLLRVNEWRAG